MEEQRILHHRSKISFTVTGRNLDELRAAAESQLRELTGGNIAYELDISPGLETTDGRIAHWSAEVEAYD